MKICVVANSKTGFTKRYADWIAEELSCAVIPYTDFTKSMADENGLVIFGSRLHAGRIEYLNKVKPLFENSFSKLIVFAVGAAPVSATSAINKFWADNFTAAELSAIPRFYMQGGLSYEKMNLLDKIMMKAAALIMGRKNISDETEEGFTEDISKSFDSSSREYIRPLVSFVKAKQ